MNQIVRNVSSLIDKYGSSINDDNRLALMYYRDIDGIPVDSRYISTQDWLTKATRYDDIINARDILELLKGGD